jgi:hypothetical protein
VVTRHPATPATRLPCERGPAQACRIRLALVPNREQAPRFTTSCRIPLPRNGLLHKVYFIPSAEHLWSVIFMIMHQESYELAVTFGAVQGPFEIDQLNGEAIQGYADYTASAADPSVTGDPLQPPPRLGVQALGHDIPLTPPPADPPQGKDPRYWIDVTKIIHVPEGQLAPYGTVQIGPGLYYPDPGSGFTYQPPPLPAKYPLDIGDIVTRAPGQLGPSGHELIAQTPQGTYWAPDPGAGYQPAPSSAPQQPIDVRDVIHVPQANSRRGGTSSTYRNGSCPGRS